MQLKHRRFAYCSAAEPGSTAAGSRLASRTCSIYMRGSLRVNLTAAAAAVCLLSAAGAQAATYGPASVLQYHKNPSKDGYYINSDLKGGFTVLYADWPTDATCGLAIWCLASGVAEWRVGSPEDANE